MEQELIPNNMFDVLETDTLFSDSPDAGDQDCLCSRCGKQIPEKDSPIIRVFTEEDTEFRYCRKCSEKAGVHYFDDPD